MVSLVVVLLVQASATASINVDYQYTKYKPHAYVKTFPTVHGFHVAGVLKHGIHKVTGGHTLLHQHYDHHHGGSDGLPARRRMEVLGKDLPWATKRDRIITQSKLCMVAEYWFKDDQFSEQTNFVEGQHILFESAETMAEVYDSGDGPYDPTDYRRAMLKMQSFYQAWEASEGVSRLNVPDSKPDDEFWVYGIVAILFERADVGRVVAFKATDGPFDNANIMNWLADWWYEKAPEKQKKMWERSGSPTSYESLPKPNFFMNLAAQALIRVITKNIMWPPFTDKVYGKLKEYKATDSFWDSAPWTLPSKASIAAKGYWPITKRLIDALVPRTKDGKVDKTAKFYIAGASQGGGRANLASMYLRKKYGATYTTSTFGAVGGACFPRMTSFTKTSDMLRDMDPTIPHPHITDYVHVLDFYGNFDEDPGNQCFLGVGDTQSPGFKYCGRVMGKNIVYLLFSNSVDFPEKDALDFKKCIYVAHQPYSYVVNLEKYLVGNTTGVCKEASAVPASLCPTGGMTGGEVAGWFMIVSLIICIVLVLVFVVLVIIRFTCCKKDTHCLKKATDWIAGKCCKKNEKLIPEVTES